MNFFFLKGANVIGKRNPNTISGQALQFQLVFDSGNHITLKRG